MKQYRLVAWIFPETDWVGNQLNEDDRPVIAREIEKGSKHYAISLQTVEPVRGEDANSLMISMEHPYLPDKAQKEDFVLFAEKLAQALALPVLHRDDFTYLGQY